MIELLLQTSILASLYLLYEIIENIFATSHPETLQMQSPLANLIFKQNFGLQSKVLEAVKTCKNVELEEIASKISILMFILSLTKSG